MAGLFLSISLPSLYSDAVPWVFIVTFGLFLGAGVIAWWRRPTNGMGALLVFASFCVYAGSLGDARPPLLQAIGAVFATTILAATVHLLHAFQAACREELHASQSSPPTSWPPCFTPRYTSPSPVRSVRPF